MEAPCVAPPAVNPSYAPVKETRGWRPLQVYTAAVKWCCNRDGTLWLLTSTNWDLTSQKRHHWLVKGGDAIINACQENL